MKMLTKMTTIATSLGALMLASSLAHGQAGVQVGVLTCTLTDVSNVVVYSTEEFACTFEGASGETQGYAGQITSIGVDLQVKKDMAIVWAVLAPTNDSYSPEALKGTYVGGSTEVSIGAGLGAKVLIGSSEDVFSLQPLSVSGIVGAGASVGIQTFELR